MTGAKIGKSSAVGTIVNDDHRPVITSGAGADKAIYTVFASELVSDTTGGTIHAVDQDAGDHVTYGFRSNPGRIFAIDAESGDLRFKAASQVGTYSTTVRAVDDAGHVDTQELTVNVVANGPLRGTSGITDVFVFKTGFGSAMVNGFNPGSGASYDVLQIDQSLVGNLSERAFLDLLKATGQSGPDTVIDLTDTAGQHELITLKNVKLSSLTADDFHFV